MPCRNRTWLTGPRITHEPCPVRATLTLHLAQETVECLSDISRREWRAALSSPIALELDLYQLLLEMILPNSCLFEEYPSFLADPLWLLL